MLCSRTTSPILPASGIRASARSASSGSIQPLRRVRLSAWIPITRRNPLSEISGARLTVPSRRRTKLPTPCRFSIRPSRSSCSSALRTVARPSPYRAESSCSVGSRLPRG